MALLYKDQVMSVHGGTTLNLTPLDKQSIRVNRIGFISPTSNQSATINISRVRVGFVPTFRNARHFFRHIIAEDTNINPYENIHFNDVNLTYPVAAGETFNITTTAAMDIYVIYDIFDEADVKNDEPNGSASNSLNYFVYLTNGTAFAPNSAVTPIFREFDTVLNPVEFSRFPVAAVPSNQEFDIHAMGHSAYSEGTGAANRFCTRRIRFRYNREVLFDPVGLGWLSQGNPAFIASGFSYDGTINVMPAVQLHKPHTFKFTPPLTFKEGDELDIDLGATGDAVGTGANNTLLWLLVTQRRL